MYLLSITRWRGALCMCMASLMREHMARRAQWQAPGVEASRRNCWPRGNRANKRATLYGPKHAARYVLSTLNNDILSLDVRYVRTCSRNSSGNDVPTPNGVRDKFFHLRLPLLRQTKPQFHVAF